MNRIRPIIAAVVTVGLTAGPAAANPWSVFGFNGYSMARGNALTGGAKGPAAVYYNPAGLIREKRRDITLSYYHGESLLDFDVDNENVLLDLNETDFPEFSDADIAARCSDDQGCIDDFDRYNDYVAGGRQVNSSYTGLRGRSERRAENVRRVDNMTVGATLPLAINPENAFAAVGAAISIPIGPVVFQRIKGPTTPFFLRYDDTPQNLVVATAAAIEPVEWLRLGVGVSLFADVSAGIDAQLQLPPELFINPLELSANFQDLQFFLDGKLTLPLSIGPTAGIQITPAKWVDFGLAFRDEQRADAKVRSNILIETPLGNNRIPVELLTGSIFTPREVAGGFTFYPSDGMAIMADVTWSQWSNYIPPFAVEASIAGVGSAACDIVGSVQNLDPLLRDVVGSLGGIADNLPFDLNSDGICDFIEDAIPNEINIAPYNTSDRNNKFNDTIAVAFGFEYGRDDWTVATGYRFDPTPVPAQTSIFNVLGADTHTISGGVDYKVLSFASIGLFSQYRILKSTTTRKSASRIATDLTADAYPDIEDANFASRDPKLAELQDLVDGRQIVTPGFPGYTVGGGYLSVGLQANVWF